MSAKSATGSAAQSVQKLVIEKDVEHQLRSKALKRRLQEESLADGSIELYLSCLDLKTIDRWGNKQPFGACPSLLRVDLSGCLLHLQGQTSADEDAETLRRL